jgi:hypothetical protein
MFGPKVILKFLFFIKGAKKIWREKSLKLTRMLLFLKNSILYIKQCCDESSIENCVIITLELFNNSKIVDKIYESMY